MAEVPITPEFLRSKLSQGAFHQFLKMELRDCDAEVGRVTIYVPWRPAYERSEGSCQWHGGPMAALIDVAGDYALIAKLGRAVPTMNLRIDYLRPAVETGLLARAQVLRAGRTVGLVDIELLDDRQRVVAVGRGNYSLYSPDAG